MNYIYDLKTLPEDKTPLSGGKAASLARMLKAGNICVPFGYVLTADAFKDGELLPSASEELHHLIEELPSKYTYAVRSSALNEDSGDASFAGQYETLTDVPQEKIFDAVKEVSASAGNARVTEYTRANLGEAARSGIAVVIQRFVKPEMAGVLFTSDVISGRDDHLVGNFVHGEGEKLVSGVENAEEFRIDALHYAYEGPSDMKPYAKKLSQYCKAIRRSYGVPMDIEWAVSGKKVYILQARPITTLRRLNMDTYEVNGTRSGYKMLTRTNVGEIFMKPVSPMTFSVLEKINDFIGLPEWLDNINGQPYMNISVMCSILVSFGKSRESAFAAIKDLAGNIPEGATVPVSPFDKKTFLKNLKTLLFPKNKCKLSKKEKHELVLNLPDISRQMARTIRGIDTKEELIQYWDGPMMSLLSDGLAAIMKESGTSLLPLFSTRKKIAKVSDEDMANRLCGGCVGVLDCMKPLLLLEDVLSGKLSKDEYVHTCGHRCVDEMELMAPRPYEDPAFPDDLIEQHRQSGVDLHKMQQEQQVAFEAALAEFKSRYPSKKKWIDKKIAKFVHANTFREYMRSLGVWLFSTFREFLLQAGKLTGLNNDVFMLTMTEILDLLRGQDDPTGKIEARKANFLRYQEYPSFPSLILGRFDPDAWVSDPNRRSDYFWDEAATSEALSASDVKGFPGAAGTITGTVKVITDLSRIDEVKKGDILVTVATNIGWTLVFPRVSAIVTDIGAPLSHAAIVAREFGIPAVVGCGNATTVLKTGDVVTVDGARGTVTKIS